ncbi:ABC transporter permease [Lactovum miscens]|uniref:Transport permease protein n=1 Tax=Lactovum miscens TaxID=190387 RepID=A0A841C7F5_9LACT|nr:ABC transporter permease [Lactovum miscens]MBB5887668.1 ABC-2 type transport system permease protein [Lactovum miscens]
MNIFEKKNRILLKELVKTDFKLRYQGSVIGYLWSVLKPIMLFLVMYLVFVKFLRFGAAVPHFAVALLLGITIWNFFSESTIVGMQAIVGRGDLLRKVSFSKSIIILSVVSNAFINLMISTTVVIIFAIINGVHFSWNVIFAVPLLFELFIFTLGIVFMISTAFVYFRDLSPVWEVVMQAGFYATPIIYPITQVSERAGNIGHYAANFMMMNPIAQIVQDMRYIFTYSNNTNPTVWQMLHNPLLIMIPYIMPIIIFFIGFWIFNRKSKKFAEVI